MYFSSIPMTSRFSCTVISPFKVTDLYLYICLALCLHTALHWTISVIYYRAIITIYFHLLFFLPSPILSHNVHRSLDLSAQSQTHLWRKPSTSCKCCQPSACTLYVYVSSQDKSLGPGLKADLVQTRLGAWCARCLSGIWSKVTPAAPDPERRARDGTMIQLTIMFVWWQGQMVAGNLGKEGGVYGIRRMHNSCFTSLGQ